MTRLAFDEGMVEIVPDGKGYAISLNGHDHHVESITSHNGQLKLLVDGRRMQAYVSSDGPHRWVTVGGRTFILTRSSISRHSAAGHAGSSELSAPMPGQVRAVHVKAGDPVTKGQVLVVLEAMKMEIRLQAPFDGEVSTVDAVVGQTVEREQVLVSLQQAATSPS